ncbi:MAG: hypothetical protein V1909_06635 [Candidatus Micrarchaeota archaeon]
MDSKFEAGINAAKNDALGASSLTPATEKVIQQLVLMADTRDSAATYPGDVPTLARAAVIEIISNAKVPEVKSFAYAKLENIGLIPEVPRPADSMPLPGNTTKSTSFVQLKNKVIDAALHKTNSKVEEDTIKVLALRSDSNMGLPDNVVEQAKAALSDIIVQLSKKVIDATDPIAVTSAFQVIFTIAQLREKVAPEIPLQARNAIKDIETLAFHPRISSNATEALRRLDALPPITSTPRTDTKFATGASPTLTITKNGPNLRQAIRYLKIKKRLESTLLSRDYFSISHVGSTYRGESRATINCSSVPTPSELGASSFTFTACADARSPAPTSPRPHRG